MAARMGADAVGPWTFNCLRFGLSAVSLVPIWLYRHFNGYHNYWRRAIFPGVLTGGFLYAGATFQQAGLAWTTAGNAAFITSMYIVIVPIFGLFFGQRIRKSAIIGIAITIPGLYLLSVTGDFQISIGDIYQMIGAMFWAGQIILVGQFSGRYSVLPLSILQFLTCGVLSGFSAFIFEPTPFQGIEAAWGPILYGGTMAGGLAFTLQILGQRKAEATAAAMIMSLEAVFGALGGCLILHEIMTSRAILGAFLLLIGVLISVLGRRISRFTTTPQVGAPPIEIENLTTEIKITDSQKALP